MWAVEARQEAEWDRAAAILANQLNIAARKHIVSPRHLNPYRHSPLQMQPPTLEDMTDFLTPQ